jgi:hypothetical protein
MYLAMATAYNQLALGDVDVVAGTKCSSAQEPEYRTGDMLSLSPYFYGNDNNDTKGGMRRTLLLLVKCVMVRFLLHWVVSAYLVQKR